MRKISILIFTITLFLSVNPAYGASPEENLIKQGDAFATLVNDKKIQRSRF